MADREQNRRENDALQSGEGNPAFGQDDRDFGTGGQTVTQELDGDDAPHRDTRRDTTTDPSREGK
jgi:hypothetical protein